MMDATVVERHDLGCPSPEAEVEAAGAAPPDGAPAGRGGQEVTPRSSPDTNSPVMINVEVRRALAALGSAHPASESIVAVV